MTDKPKAEALKSLEQVKDWRIAEATLFNLITRLGLAGKRYLFSNRVRIAQAMINAMRNECASIDKEVEDWDRKVKELGL